MLIDSHCHLHDREFFSEEQAEKMLKNADENGVKQIIVIGTGEKDSLAARDFANSHKNVFWTFGIHPEYAADGWRIKSLCDQIFSQHVSNPVILDNSYQKSRNSEASQRRDFRIGDFSDENVVKKIGRAETRCEKFGSEEILSSNKLVAIGEVGLDYHQENFDKSAQIKLFEEMLQLAQDNDLPVCFHIREAFPDFFGVISNFPKIKGVVHSFTDSKKNLKKILETTDFYVGVNGLATYSTLPLPPLERIVLETDAPFLTPAPFRGIINESAYVKNIADWLSTKLGVSSEEIAEKTTENVRKVYKLPNPEL